jgi:hypothetical protein
MPEALMQIPGFAGSTISHPKVPRNLPQGLFTGCQKKRRKHYPEELKKKRVKFGHADESSRTAGRQPHSHTIVATGFSLWYGRAGYPFCFDKRLSCSAGSGSDAFGQMIQERAKLSVKTALPCRRARASGFPGT